MGLGTLQKRGVVNKMGKDQIRGLVVAVAVVLLMFFVMGVHSDDKKVINKSLNQQVDGLNQWFEGKRAVEGERNRYVSAIKGCARDKRTLLVELSKEQLEINNVTPDEVAQYAFNVIQQYPGNISAFDNFDDKKQIDLDKVALYTRLI